MTPYVSDRMLEEIIVEEDRYVLIAFLSRDSIPCSHFIPEFEGFAATSGSRIRCVRICVDENPSIAGELLVESVPTTLVYRCGDEVARFEGPYSAEALINRVGDVIGKGGA